MSAKKKRVRFRSANVAEGDKSLTEALTLQHLETGNQSGASLTRSKRRKRKRTKLQALKTEKKKLQKDLKSTKEWILDENKRKASPSYTLYENRQRLARTAGDTISKLRQIEGKILVKEKSGKQKTQTKLSSKLKKTTIRAEKQHSRLIKMTENLEKMKTGENSLRAEIAREQTAKTKDGDFSDTFRFPRIKSADSAQWVNISTCKPGHKLDSYEQDESPRPTSVLSDFAMQMSPREKKRVADKLAHKYNMTRELRNTIHEHMITRSYSFSYLNIIPPYAPKKAKPQKTKQVFSRLVYEDKIGVVDFKKKYPKQVSLSS